MSSLGMKFSSQHLNPPQNIDARFLCHFLAKADFFPAFRVLPLIFLPQIQDLSNFELNFWLIFKEST